MEEVEARLAALKAARRQASRKHLTSALDSIGRGPGLADRNLTNDRSRE